MTDGGGEDFTWFGSASRFRTVGVLVLVRVRAGGRWWAAWTIALRHGLSVSSD